MTKDKQARTGLGTVANKVKDVREDFDNYKEKVKRENRRIGLALIIGIPIINLILPKLIGTRFSFNINPHLGPLDWLGILIGLCFLWKSK